MWFIWLSVWRCTCLISGTISDLLCDFSTFSFKHLSHRNSFLILCLIRCLQVFSVRLLCPVQNCLLIWILSAKRLFFWIIFERKPDIVVPSPNSFLVSFFPLCAAKAGTLTTQHQWITSRTCYITTTPWTASAAASLLHLIAFRQQQHQTTPWQRHRLMKATATSSWITANSNNA